MESNQSNSLESGVVASKVVVDAFKNAGIYSELARNLSGYNTMRGGANGFKGFVFEEMHAASANIKSTGAVTEVLANNGPADFIIKHADGTSSYGQAKVGYNTSKIDWLNYNGSDIIVDKGNEQLIRKAQNAGMNVVESDVSNKQAQSLAKTMQFESKVTGKTTAPITSNLHAYHQAGLQSAKTGGAFGGGFSLGSNIVDVAYGDKEIGEAVVDVAVDTAISTAGSYVIGAGVTAAANTAVGAAVTSGLATAGTAIASTTVGAAAATATATATAAVTGAAATVGGAVASTTVGAAVTGAAATATAALGATAVGMAAMAVAPVVAGGAIVGGLFALGKRIFD